MSDAVSTTADHDEVSELRARLAALEELLIPKQNDFAARFGLHPVPARLFGLLMKVPYVTTELAERANVCSDLRVNMCRLRKTIEPHGITIHSKRYQGYWLDDETKDRVRAMITCEGDPSAVN